MMEKKPKERITCEIATRKTQMMTLCQLEIMPWTLSPAVLHTLLPVCQTTYSSHALRGWHPTEGTGVPVGMLPTGVPEAEWRRGEYPVGDFQNPMP